MSHKQQLRALRSGTVINSTSRKQETEIIQALRQVEEHINTKHDLQLIHDKQWLLSDIVGQLRQSYKDVSFHYHFKASSIRPDGGILSILGDKGRKYPILISEVKNQGTNDLRQKEGLTKQAKGNAIERLGKNVIGLRAALRMESIFPFVCFGYGCDFADDSSILDRVTTINMFGKLCETNLYDQGPNGLFDRGSYYFREHKWSVNEMAEVMSDIAGRAILYYLSKYGENILRND